MKSRMPEKKIRVWLLFVTNIADQVHVNKLIQLTLTVTLTKPELQKRNHAI